MAILDERNRVVVLRIVYAGPPLSGKTETVRSLCAQLRSSRQPGEVYTPDEAGARTLFFDWLEHVGGTFHGRTIRCQIIAVPGQSMLYRRRQLLLQSADAVVFVVDSRPEHSEAISASYQEMRRFIEKPEDSSPVGIIVQANKSDLADAMPAQALQALLATGPDISIMPTVATEGTGLRETFVQAVGIALERVRALMDSGQLTGTAGPVSIETGEELLQQIKALEDAELGEVQRVVVEILNTIDLPLPASEESVDESEAQEPALSGPEAHLPPPIAPMEDALPLPDLPPEEALAEPLTPPAAVSDPEPALPVSLATEPSAAEPALPFGTEAANAEPALPFAAAPAVGFGAEPPPADAADSILPFGSEQAPAAVEVPALPFGTEPEIAAAAEPAAATPAELALPFGTETTAVATAEAAPADAPEPALPVGTEPSGDTAAEAPPAAATEPAPMAAADPTPVPADEATEPAAPAAAASEAAVEDPAAVAAPAVAAAAASVPAPAPEALPAGPSEAPAASAVQEGGEPAQASAPAPASPAAPGVPQDVVDAAAVVATAPPDGSVKPAQPVARASQAADLPKDAWAAVAAPAVDAGFAPLLAAQPAPSAAHVPSGSWDTVGAPEINVTDAPATAAPAQPVTVHPPRDAWVAVQALPLQAANLQAAGSPPAAPAPVTVYPPRGAWASVHVHPPRGAWAALQPGDNTLSTISPRLPTGINRPPVQKSAGQVPPATSSGTATGASSKVEGVAARFELIPEPEAAAHPAPERQTAGPSKAATPPHATQAPKTAPKTVQQSAKRSATPTVARPTLPPQSVPAPVTPDKRVGAGMVWPPIAGRHVLNALSGGQPRLRQLPNQAWVGESGRWLLLSLPEHAFNSEVLAREEMLRLSRSHSLLKPVLTEQRCVSCTANRGNDWRIWQVVRRETTLADVLQLMHGLPTAESIVTELLRIAYLLGVALARFRAASLFCAPTLDKIAVSQGGPVYSGFVLPTDTTSNGHSEALGAAGLIRRELQGAITALAKRLELMPQLLRQLEANKRSAPPGDRVAETLIAMFLHTDTRT